MQFLGDNRVLGIIKIIFQKFKGIVFPNFIILYLLQELFDMFMVIIFLWELKSDETFLILLQLKVIFDFNFKL